MLTTGFQRGGAISIEPGRSRSPSTKMSTSRAAGASPTGVVARVGDTEKRLQHFLGRHIGPQRPFCLGPAHQRADRLDEPSPRIDVERIRAVGDGRESGEHPPLGRDHPEVCVQPAPERLRRVGLGQQLLCEGDEFVDLVAVDRLEQRLARREVSVKRGNSDAGTARHRLEAGAGAALGEDVAGGRKQPLTVPHDVRAGGAPCLWRILTPSCPATLLLQNGGSLRISVARRTVHSRPPPACRSPSRSQHHSIVNCAPRRQF